MQSLALDSPLAPQIDTKISSGENTSHYANEIDQISKRIWDVLKSGYTPKKTQLEQDITHIKPEELKEILTTFFDEAVTSETIEDPSLTMEKLAAIIPFEQLQEAVGKDQKTALMKAKSMFNQAKYYLENSQARASPTLLSNIEAILDSVLSFIESILDAFGVARLFKHPESHFQSQFNFQKIMMLVSFFSMLTTMLIPLLGPMIAAPIIGGTLLLIGVLSVIYPLISPLPLHLPHAKNWSKEFLQNDAVSLSLLKARKNILDTMANTLIKNSDGKLKKHPLLIGKSRVGKTQTAKALVHAIERGDYPELKGKKVFYINTTKLCKKGDLWEGKDPIEQISAAMGRHKENIILVFDEIHVAFQGEKNAIVGQKLKEMLDPNGDFPYVIGITTSQEFLNNISLDEAFVNRFNPITLENTSPEITKEILNKSILTSESKPFCEKGIAEMIHKKTSEQNWTQPYSSLVLLKECMQLTSDMQESQLKKDIQVLMNKKEFLASNSSVNPIDFENPDETSYAIEELEEKINALSLQLKKETEKIDLLFQRKDQISDVKLETFRTVMKVAMLKGNTPLTTENKAQLNAFLLMSHFLSPALEKFVKNQSKKLGIQAVIDEAVIESAFKKQKELEDKKNNAVKQAHNEKIEAQKLLK
jgi:hypothetical protein